MKFSTMKQQFDVRRSGVPEEFADRTLLKAQEVRGTFINDVPAVIIRKPKNQEDKDTKQRVRVTTKKGEPVFQDVLYLPIILGSEKCVVVTAMEENTQLVKAMFDELPDPEYVKGDAEDINRWEKYVLPETIEGELQFKAEIKTYKDGSKHPVPVLSEA